MPIGGHTKATSSAKKASVAEEPGKAYREKKREERALEGDAKRSTVKPPGRKWRFVESVYQTTEEEGGMQSARIAFLRVRSSR